MVITILPNSLLAWLVVTSQTSVPSFAIFSLNLTHSISHGSQFFWSRSASVVMYLISSFEQPCNGFSFVLKKYALLWIGNITKGKWKQVENRSWQWYECALLTNTGVVFRLVLCIRISVNHIKERIRVTMKYWIGSNSGYSNQFSKKTRTERKQVQDVFTDRGMIHKIKIFQLVGSIPSNHLHEMFGFQDRFPSRLSLVACTVRPASGCIGLHLLTCT